MKYVRRSILALLFALLSVVGCEHADPLDPDRIEPTLSSIQANIFDLSCAVSGCHLGNSAPFGLDLSAGNARSNLVNVNSTQCDGLPRVTPGDPDDSCIIRKLEGGPGIRGQRMPLTGAPLPQEQIDLIRAWIADGAPDN
jgi:hypothetical protein